MLPYHAAGVAAALTIGKENYDVKEVQKELLRQNAFINKEEEN